MGLESILVQQTLRAVLGGDCDYLLNCVHFLSSITLEEWLVVYFFSGPLDFSRTCDQDIMD